MPTETKNRELERMEREEKRKAALETQQRTAVLDLQKKEQERIDGIEEGRLRKADETFSRHEKAPAFAQAPKPLPFVAPAPRQL